MLPTKKATQTVARRPLKSNAASCLVAVAFLLVLAGAATLTVALLLRARQPRLTLLALQLPLIQLAGTSNATASRSVSVSVTRLSVRAVLALRNPNRGVFDYYDSDVALASGSATDTATVAELALPAGHVAAGQTVQVHVALEATPFSLHSPAGAGAGAGTATDGGGVVLIPLQLEAHMAGRVNALYLFTHHVRAVLHCNVLLSSASASASGGAAAVLACHCTPAS